MATTSNIQIVPLDFDAIRADLKRYLQAQTEFQDYNFEGSSLALLLDILAYDAYYHGWYTNFAVNEVFLQTAQIRNSVVAAAKQVGYIPRSVTGSVAEVNITVNDVAVEEGTLLLPKYTSFQSNVAGTLFTFYTLDDALIYPNGNTNVAFSGVQLREGTLLTQTYDITESNYSDTGTVLRVLNQNVDTTTISVTVNPTNTSDISYVYTRATSAVTVNASSNVYFLFETNSGDYEIQFGDNRLGRNLNIGQRVVIKYLDSRGSASSGANTFTYISSALGTVSQTTNVSVVLSNVNIPSYGGAPRESIESIKRLAPNIYQAQGRIVTPDDARATLLSEVSGIDSLTIWGGEDNDPPTYGKMFICLKPVNAERFGPTQKAQIIKNVLRPKASPILGFETVDPDYIYLVTDSEVRYSSASTALSAQELQQTVSAAIQNYTTQYLGQFGSYFRYSQLSRVIDTAEISIQSNMSTVLLEKKFRIDTGATSYTLNFANPLFAPSTTTGIGGYSSANGVVSVSSKIGTQTFSHIDESGFVQKFCWVENDGTALNVYKTDADNTTVTVKSNVGVVDFTLGLVTFTNFSPRAITTNLINELRVRAIPLNSDVAPNRSQIILLPADNIKIAMVEDLLNRRNTTTGRSNFVGQLGFGSFGA
jgi:hypothetical protein